MNPTERLASFTGFQNKLERLFADLPMRFLRQEAAGKQRHGEHQ